MYAQNLESHRANVAREQEEKRYHVESLSETIRSNIARETETNRYNTLYLNELSRSNRAKEQYNLLQLQETSRHNYVTEGLTAAQNKLRKYEADNALYLGMGNLANSREYNLYQNELAQARAKTEAETTKKVSKETELTGARAASERSLIDLRQAQTKTENELRNSKKFSNYAGGVGSILRGASPLIHLFGGI